MHAEVVARIEPALERMDVLAEELAQRRAALARRPRGGAAGGQR